MEWIVMTAPTVDEARDRALDALSVAAEDAEIEVLAVPTRSHWGLRHHGARVRVRVRPTGPPPRVGEHRRDRRQRRRSGGGNRNAKRRQGAGQSQNSGGRSSRRRSRSGRRGGAARSSGPASNG